eukprot:scaffold116722_cov75-Phaeocystis_antarctica.AAC.2
MAGSAVLQARVVEPACAHQAIARVDHHSGPRRAVGQLVQPIVAVSKGKSCEGAVAGRAGHLKSTQVLL